MEQPRIAIIGAGPGGLMLARLLKVQGIPFKLYELDKSPSSRSQGGSLDIHADSGQLALKEGLLLSEFEKHARYESAALTLRHKDGTVIFAFDGSIGGEVERPEIDRTALRQILLNSLDDGLVIWGKKVVGVEEESSSTKAKPQYSIEFEGGERESGFQLMVGADGAWSKVRLLLTDKKPFYSGITNVEVHVDNIDNEHPDLAKRIGKGSCYQFADGKGLSSQRVSDGSVGTYVGLRVPEDWSTTCGIDWADSDKAKRILMDTKFSDWDPLGKDFVLRSNCPIIVRPMYMLPTDIHWQTRHGVTLLGDAAHLMTPYAGVGVNLALTDALDLSHAIRAHFQENLDWSTAIRQYEGKLLTRGHVNAEQTYSNLKVFFGPGGPDVIAKRVEEAVCGSDAN